MANRLINETDYIAYFTGLASKHKVIRHGVDNRQSFFFLPIEMDLREIENALKNAKATPFLALDALRGAFNDGGSSRNLQTVSGQFFVLDKVKTGEQQDIRRAEDLCLNIGFQILNRMVVDLKGMEAGSTLNGARFTMDGIQYDPVGPIAVSHYGYTFRFSLTCPLSFTVDSAIWSDKT